LTGTTEIVIVITTAQWRIVVEKFTVGGKKISINLQLVEDLLEGVTAGPINKNFVVVRGKRFPVKQALAIVAKLPLGDFISTEAIRVFKSLGFEIGRVREKGEPARNESELLLEQYLQNHGLGHYRFQPHMAGTSKLPDYMLSINASQILLEVKQFEPTPGDFTAQGGAYDPYAPIIEKIEAGRKKFKDLENYTCCLVLFNCGRPLVDLSWRFVYGAMLGRMAFQMPFDPVKGQMVEEEGRWGFTGGGGKMHRYQNGKPIQVQNQTISAIIVLEQLPLGRRRFRAEMQKREAELGPAFSLEKSLAMLDEARGTERDWGLLQLRTVTCENPYVIETKRLPSALFTGPFDERYGNPEGSNQITRVHCGEEIRRLEDEEEVARQMRAGTRKNLRELPPVRERRAISFDDDTK
jgi:hypothetical protein